MFTPKYIKEAKLLCKGARKFGRYKKDVMEEGRGEEIDGLIADLEAAYKAKDKEKVETASKVLIETCESAAPTRPHPGIRENVEVIFVALVIAVGIRTYFLQPFRIPTGSMQPTLNGVIAAPVEEWPGGHKPNILSRAFHKVWFGRTYVEVVVPKSGNLRPTDTVTEHKFLRFFTYSRIHYEDGTSIRVNCPRQQLTADDGLGLMKRLALTPQEMAGGSAPGQYRFNSQVSPVHEGDLLARGYIDSGDQVFVNKFAYHFRTPVRGEIFVFNTNGIRGIETRKDFDPRFGSQHYIKRLVGVPGDTYAVETPNLILNGAPAEEPGMRRVMSLEDGYGGYGTKFGTPPYNSGTLTGDQYLAMGDNSYHSFDSRGWGAAPEENLVGPGFFVYWPFGHHFGVMK